MSPKTARTRVPDPLAQPAALGSVAETTTRRAQTVARLRELRDRYTGLEKASLRGLSEVQLDERTGELARVKQLIRQAEEEESELQGELKRAKAEEGEAAAIADAGSAEADVDRALSEAQAAAAAARATADRLHRVVSRLFDPAVRRRLTSDPTLGRRGDITKLCPTLGRLVEFERDDMSLVIPPPADRWPTLSWNAATGGAEFTNLERIQSAADLEAWLGSFAAQSLPGGSKADRQLAELRAKFGRRFPVRGTR